MTSATGLNKAQRASLTVVCPECGAAIGQRCVTRVGIFSHVSRYQKANKTSSTGRRGDPLMASR